MFEPLINLLVLLSALSVASGPPTQFRALQQRAQTFAEPETLPPFLRNT